MVTPTTALESQILTGKEAYALGNMGRYELVEGVIIPMSPTKPLHGKYESRLGLLLSTFVEQDDLGEVMVGEVGIYVQRNPDTVRGADVLYISHERLAQASRNDFLDVPPELVIEVMSPNDRWTEVRRKLREYFAVGVNVVMVVEPEEKVVSLYRSLTNVQEFTPPGVVTLPDVLPGFKMPLELLFKDRGRNP